MSDAFKDQVESTLSSGVTDSASAWPLTSATTFPDPAADNVGPYWVWAWDEGTFPNPKDDSGAERVRVSGKTGDTLTVVRNEAGSTGVAHSSGETVAMLADEANVKNLYRIDVTPFGGETSGLSDATAAVQAAMDAAIDAKRPLYIPSGEFRIDGTLTYNHASARQLHIVGDGWQNSILKDNNTSGPFLTVDMENVYFKMRDIQVKIGGNKHAHYSMELGAGQVNGHFEDVFWQGSNVGVRALLFIDNAWNMVFTNCFWNNYGGIGIDFRATRNAGNLRFVGGKFNFGRAAIFTRDGATVDGIAFLGTKFVGSHNGDWLTHSSLSTWTLGATTINVGAGRNTGSGANHQVVLSNDTHQELHTVDTYTSGTGDLVLQTGLEFDWSADTSAEIFIGSPGPVLTNRSTAVTFNSCHFEMTPVILSRTDGTVFNGCIFNGTENISNSNGATWSTTTTPLNMHNLYLTGAHCRNTVLVGCRVTTDRTDNKMIYCVDPAGDSAVPGDITIINLGDISSGSVSRITNPITATSTSTQQVVISGQDIYLGQKSAAIKAGATGTAQISIPQCRSDVQFDTVHAVTDANFTYVSGVSAAKGHIDMAGLTADRTVTLPPSPQIGRICTISKSDSSGNTVQVLRNGQFINGAAADSAAFSTQHAMHVYKYIGGLTGWNFKIL